ncbi:hypothetical protein ACQ4PT_038491 [Festuca glaucescens]
MKAWPRKEKGGADHGYRTTTHLNCGAPSAETQGRAAPQRKRLRRQKDGRSSTASVHGRPECHLMERIQDLISLQNAAVICDAEAELLRERGHGDVTLSKQTEETNSMALSAELECTEMTLPQSSTANTTSRALSAELECTEMTLPQSSIANTPLPGPSNRDARNAEAVSTPQAPFPNMTFDTLEDAHRRYLSFSYKRGFGIRYNYRKKSQVTGEIIRAAMVCHKAGHQAKEKEDTQKPKPVVAERNKSTNARTECPARMLVKLRDREWVVTEFNDEHNHPIFKKWSLTSFLRSHRHIPEEDKDFIRVLHTVNMETSRMMQVMAQLYESVEGVPYTHKDMANFRSTLRAQNKFTDMQNTMEYFEEMKLQDKDFYYRYKLDDEDRVQYLLLSAAFGVECIKTTGSFWC